MFKVDIEKIIKNNIKRYTNKFIIRSFYSVSYKEGGCFRAFVSHEFCCFVIHFCVASQKKNCAASVRLEYEVSEQTFLFLGQVIKACF